jgi:tetratricopeptide (TPR) repeat protein
VKRLALVALLLAASVQVPAQAQGNVWEHATAPDAATQDKYETELRQGDEHAVQANTRSSGSAEVENQVALEATAYRAAAATKPTEAEPLLRLARLLHSFYLECADTSNSAYWSRLCKPASLNRKKAQEVIDAWDAAEVRAPLDPRFSVGAFGESEILFRRAILHTKLGSKPHLEAAARDYEKILARQDNSDGGSEPVSGNLAETYMKLGRLEEAVEQYKDALRSGSDSATWYGFAVALDRDERTDQALEVIRSLGREQRDQFHTRVIRGDTFFVPEGEKFYYFALVDEALGMEEEAISYWRQFINSGAHPQYQPRAKAHLDALLKKRRKTPLPIEPPWGGILR